MRRCVRGGGVGGRALWRIRNVLAVLTRSSFVEKVHVLFLFVFCVKTSETNTVGTFTAGGLNWYNPLVFKISVCATSPDYI